MSRLAQIKLMPHEIKDEALIRSKIRSILELKDQEFSYFWRKRSIDARSKRIYFNCTFEVFVSIESIPIPTLAFQPKEIEENRTVAIIGAGPAGLFAALSCIENGIKPIVFERGKNVRARRRDLAQLTKEGIVDPNSNYCFGEGGAGTYSDGKLYTRSKKRGDVDKVLRTFVQFGADEDILVDAHPHIGTNKLPAIIVAIREEIIKNGGEVHFESRLTDLIIKNNKVQAIEINNHLIQEVENVVLATGHSARDIFYLLRQKAIRLDAKPFALGVRVEHRQEIIDRLQYHGQVHGDYLPPASYSLVAQIDDKGVYSFCMCPGGIIAPCATDSEEVVTNGWSPSKRNNPYSNAGIVVSISPEDFPDQQNNPFVCLNFQMEIEKKCWEAAGKTQKVPAQRLMDFIQRRKSKDFPRSSYNPGITSVEMDDVLPDFVAERLRKAFVVFDTKMKGFLTNDAVLHAPESRTSSPICIPRNNETLEHIEIEGLYPCGEGAGYAGGIVSAAIDGMHVVMMINDKISSNKTHE